MTNYYIFNNASRAAKYGIGTYVIQLTEILLKFDDIHIVLVDLYADTKEFSIKTDEQGITHYLFPNNGTNIESKIFCKSISCILSHHINGNEKNIFHFNYFQHYDIARNLKAIYIKSRIIFAVHYFNWCFQLDGNLTKFRKIIANSEENNDNIRIGFLQDKAFLRLADHIIALSMFSKEVLNKDYKINPEKIHFIPNGLADIKTETQVIPFTATDSENFKYILFVGRLDNIKGIGYLLKAFRILLKKINDIQLLIVGDGDYNKYFKQCKGIWNKVIFTGKISHTQLYTLHQRATLAVLPSFHEQCSYSAIEFMRHKLAFVGTDSTGLKEMLTCVPEAIVHINEDYFEENIFVTQLASKIEKLLTDKKFRVSVSKRMRQLYESKYSQEFMYRNTKCLLYNLYNNEEKIVSEQLLEDIDERMVYLIHKQPNIDINFYGLAGIGVYLWWRILKLNHDPNKENIKFYLSEFLIYYLDWLSDSITENNTFQISESLADTLLSMKKTGFYNIKTTEIIRKLKLSTIDYTKGKHLNDFCIIGNALKIFNTEI